MIVRCGGWSFRKSLFGSDATRETSDPRLDPNTEPARVRASFVAPAFARQGIGSAIMKRCKHDLFAMGFKQTAISATLARESLYARFGYQSVDRYTIALQSTKPMVVVKMAKTFA